MLLLKQLVRPAVFSCLA